MNEKDIYLKIQKWLDDKKEVALASVVDTWGSSPRPVGSVMAISDSHEIIGSVSGGCVENFVLGKALETLKNNRVEILDFGVSNSKAWEVGLTCGGKIKVFLEKISYTDLDLVKKINQTFIKSQYLVLATRLKDGKKIFLDKKTELNNKILEDHYEHINKYKKSTLKLLSDEMWFFKVFKSNIKIVIVGAVHIAEPLISLANVIGHEICLIDPRDNFNDKIFDNISIYKDWPDEALKKINLDENTAVVTLTHDPKLDDPALIYALKSKAFYIGCLGSNKTHASRIARLKMKGFDLKELNKLNGPVGLDIGAKTPEEIALSIISEIIKNKNYLYA